MYEVIEVKDKEQLDYLYGCSAFTVEGLLADEENLEKFVGWLMQEGAKPMPDLHIYVTKGSLMNDVYGLTGDNAYQNDLNIVSVSLDDLENYMAVVFSRFSIGGRWFDDIVDNNRSREEDKAF